MHSEPTRHPPRFPAGGPCAAAAVVAAALAARLYLFYRLPLVNPDGFLYIQQAKAVYYGLFDQVLDCYFYLSPLPLVIAALYPLSGDWVATAQLINVFFGTVALVPLYLLLRLFFATGTAAATLLVFALLPDYVAISTSIVRDPMFWCFASGGLFFFVRQLERRRPWLLVWSGACFALATWSRIEGGLFIVVSGAFVLFSKRDGKWADIACFLSPYLFFLAAGLAAGAAMGVDTGALLNPRRVLNIPLGLGEEYRALRKGLKALYDPQYTGINEYFLQRARNLVWLVGLGTLFVQLAETLLYLFFLVLAAGFASWARRLRSDPRVAYLGTLSLLALPLLYFQILYTWVMTSRFTAVFLLPAAVFVGAGIEALRRRLSRPGRPSRGLAVAVLVTIALFAPKVLRVNYDRDKLLFHEIGRYIAQREQGRRPVSVCGAFKRVRTIHFFANIDLPAAPCFDDRAILPGNGAPDPGAMARNGCHYFVWDALGWTGDSHRDDAPAPVPGLKALQRWHSSRRGGLVLFEVVP